MHRVIGDATIEAEPQRPLSSPVREALAKCRPRCRR